MLSLKRKLRNIYGSIRALGRDNPFLPHEKVITLFASFLKPKIYVELGVYECALINKMIPFVSEKAIGVDVVKTAGDFLKKSNKSEFFNGTTEAFLEEVKKRSLVIDMIFIDADHRKESVLNDFKMFFPYVKEDGIIFLHDGYPKDKEYTQDGYCSNCFEAIEELGKDTREYELMTIPLHPGLTICRKRNKQVAWM